MRPKKLRQTTIIPQELYVPRDADRQLHRVIDDMGRPGYILVARQMGKTNLLLNAKRNLQTKDDIFIYLDLSGTYPTARDCFRSIVDTAHDTHVHVFSGAYQSILRERARRDLPAHKEHEAELRLLLSATTGKIVIILDEIDALTRSDYSDQIFSQIRSIYFARVNFPEYNRLTYVLSGVAEPTEIIKNPNLSPFNIGEKIYLDDFTFEEFGDFLQKSELNLSDEASRHIFDWTNGNPRITWDVCSEIEEQMRSGASVTKSSIDAAINKLYLTAFDKPPVDHIRALAEHDSIIRNAIVQIRYGKGDTLSDATRSRLYLAGIVKADIRNIRIKNRIIDESLSDQWLHDIENRKTGILPSAIDAVKSAKYPDAIALLKKFLDNAPENPTEKATAHFHLGIALEGSGDPKEAIPHFECALNLYNKSSQPAAYEELTYRISICHALSGSTDTAIQHLERFTSGTFRGSFYFPALLKLASLYQLKNNDDGIQQAIAIYSRVISETSASESNLDRDAVRQQRALARFSLAKHYEHIKDEASAKRMLFEALADAPAESKPRILLECYRLERDPTARAETLAQIADSIITPALEIREPNGEAPLAFDTEALNSILLAAYNVSPHHTFRRLMDYIVSSSSSPTRRRAEQLNIVSVHAFSASSIAACKELAALAFDAAMAAEDLSPDILEDIVKTHALFGESERGFAEYLKLVQAKKPPVKLDTIDILIFLRGAALLQRKGSHRQTLDALTLALSYLDSSAPEAIIALERLSMISHKHRRDTIEERRAAERILNLAPSARLDRQTQPFFDKNAFSTIVALAERVLYGGARPSTPVLHNIRRNDRIRVRYSDGRELTDKYKRFESDLKLGKCTLIGLAD